MALKLDGVTGAKRSEYYLLNPYEVIVEESMRGRHKAPTQEDIVRRAVNMHEVGQIQPVECRRNEKNQPLLTLGFTRTASARLIREGFEYDFDDEVEEKYTVEVDGESVEKTRLVVVQKKGHIHDPNFMLKVNILDCNEEEAFIRNISENNERNPTTPIDDAHNQRKLRDRWGYSDRKIAQRYNYPAKTGIQKVQRLAKLLNLDFKIQDLVHTGQMAVSAALDLLELPEADRDMAVDIATTDSGKVDTTFVRQVVRDHHLRDTDENNPEAQSDDSSEGAEGSEETPAPKEPKGKQRSMREVRAWLDDLRGEENDPALRAWAKDCMAFLAGKKSDTQMNNAMGRLLDAKRTKKAA